MTHVGVLEMEDLKPEVAQRFGDATSWFQNLFSEQSGLLFEKRPVLSIETVPDITACDAWIITGSRFSVYDDIAWLPPMRCFIQDAVAHGVPLLGICFGHQLMVQAMGGTVEKSSKGLGIGVHQYDLTQTGKDIFRDFSSLRIMATHNDQAIVPPPKAVLLARSDFCNYAAFAYGGNAMSFQGHPEITRSFETYIIDASHNADPAVIEKARRSLDEIEVNAKAMAIPLANLLKGIPLPLKL